MSHRLLLYSRADCCLCEEMKTVIRRVAESTPVELDEIEIDCSADLKQKYGKRFLCCSSTAAKHLNIE